MGKYIVSFKQDTTKEQIDKYVSDLEANGGEVTHRYGENSLNGFAAHIPETFLSNLQGNDLIEFIEPDSIVTTQQQ